MVAAILGRSRNEDGVLVEESSSAGNNMQQVYTCVTMSPIVTSLKATLNSSNPTMVMPAKFDDGTEASEIKSIQVSWYLNNGEDALKYSNFDGNGIFSKNAPLPPVLSVGLIQTSGSFSLDDFDVTKDGSTNRGTVYLVPVGATEGNLNEGEAKRIASGKEQDDETKNSDKYIGAWNGAKNIITNKKDGKNSGFLKSNDKTVNNKPYAVYCDSDKEYACSVTIELPEPINGNRSNKTFMIVLSLPYVESGADVDLAFCKKEEGCSSSSGEIGEGGEGEQNSERVDIKGVQISIDSTGRANDLYRRIETRLMPEAITRPLYAINADINKNLSPTCENDFIVSNCD